MIFKPLESNQTPRHILDEAQQDEFDQTVPELTQSTPVISIQLTPEYAQAPYVLITSDGFRGLLTKSDAVGTITIGVQVVKRIKTALLGSEEEDDDYRHYLQYYQEKEKASLVTESGGEKKKYIEITNTQTLFEIPVYVISGVHGAKSPMIMISLPTTLPSTVCGRLRKSLFDTFRSAAFITVFTASIESSQQGTPPAPLQALLSSTARQSATTLAKWDLPELTVPNLVSGMAASLISGAELAQRECWGLVVNNYGVSYGGMEYIESQTKRVIISVLETVIGVELPRADDGQAVGVNSMYL